MAQERQVTRRTALEVGGAVGIGVVGLAACSSSGSKSGNQSGSPTATGPIAKLSDVPVGGSASATVQGKPVIVSQKVAGTVAAFSAICSHMGCTVGSGGAQLHCPCHGSIYDAFTGDVVHGPAQRALTPITVKVEGSNIVAG
jgi:Rieske Fe-S protein